MLRQLKKDNAEIFRRVARKYLEPKSEEFLKESPISFFFISKRPVTRKMFPFVDINIDRENFDDILRDLEAVGCGLRIFLFL